MQFSGQSENLDIVSEVDLLCDSSVTSYPLLAKVRRYNAFVNELVGDVINSDGTWQWDDTNYTDLPVGTSTLIEGQQSYTFSSNYLQITSVEILDSGGNLYKKIKPIDLEQLGGLGPDEYFGLTSAGNPATGFPQWYDILGDTVFLYLSPTSSAVTLASGLRVRFKRSHREITMSDSTTVQSGEETREPPFPTTHHMLLAYMMSIPYCMSYKKDRVAWLERKVGSNDPSDRLYGGMKKTLMKHYAFRHRDKRNIMKGKRINYI